MQSEDRVWVWGLNKRLAELERSNGNTVSAIREYYKFNERQTPLKIAMDDIYYDLNIPIEIINLITIYNTGGTVYHYSKRFHQHAHNTIYILPIILGYLQTFLFVLFICVLTFVPRTRGDILLVIALLFAILLIIHGSCALLSYHKCKDYEIIIGNFKKALYNDEDFIQHLKSTLKLNAHQNIDNNNALKAPLLHTEQRRGLMKYGTFTHRHRILALVSNTETEDAYTWQSILNPSNNLFAYVAYQRWLNVKYLALKNDSFTRSKAALCLALGKYWIPSYFILSIIIVLSTLTKKYIIVAIVWLVIYCHSFFGLYYCCLRVFQDLQHRPALLETIKVVVLCYGIGVICTVINLIWFYYIVGPAEDKRGTHKPESKGTIVMVEIIWPIISGLCAFPSICIQINILYNIIKYNRHTSIVDFFWLNSVYGSFWMGLFFLEPSWGTVVISEVFLVVMVISFYMLMQQLLHRIMTGLKRQQYITTFIANHPQHWLKKELKLLFIYSLH